MLYWYRHFIWFTVQFISRVLSTGMSLFANVNNQIPETDVNEMHGSVIQFSSFTLSFHLNSGWIFYFGFFSFLFFFFSFISRLKLPGSWCHLADWCSLSKARHCSLGVVTTAMHVPACARRFGLMRKSPAESSALRIQIKQFNMLRRKPASSLCLFTYLFIPFQDVWWADLHWWVTDLLNNVSQQGLCLLSQGLMCN